MIRKNVPAILYSICLLLVCALLGGCAAERGDGMPVSGRSAITTHSGAGSEHPLDFPDGTPVQYTCSLRVHEEDPTEADVELSFVIGEGDSAYSFSVSGDVYRLEIDKNTVLLRGGPLEGNFFLGEDEYRLLAGFTKLEGQDDINVGLTIFAEDGSFGKLCSFGSFVMTEELHTAWYTHFGRSVPPFPKSS